MSNNASIFRQLNVTENCSNLIQIASASNDDMSHHMYHAWKRDADLEYFGELKWN